MIRWTVCWEEHMITTLENIKPKLLKNKRNIKYLMK
jgi:hypothetical protein